MFIRIPHRLQVRRVWPFYPARGWRSLRPPRHASLPTLRRRSTRLCKAALAAALAAVGAEGRTSWSDRRRFLYSSYNDGWSDRKLFVLWFFRFWLRVWFRGRARGGAARFAFCMGTRTAATATRWGTG